MSEKRRQMKRLPVTPRRCENLAKSKSHSVAAATALVLRCAQTTRDFAQGQSSSEFRTSKASRLPSFSSDRLDLWEPAPRRLAVSY